MGLWAMGSTDFTKLLFLLSIAQRLEWRGQTQFCWSSTIWLVANRFGPTTVRTKRANSERRLDQPENFWGPLFMGPCWLSFQCPECSLYSIAPLAFTSGGHYWKLDLKVIFLKCKIRFIYVGFSCKRKKSGVKKCLEILTIMGGGGVDALWQKPS